VGLAMGNSALLAVIAVVPLVALMLTSFVKVSVVLSLVRNAIGAPDAPSGLVIMGISLILTFFVMAPVAVQMAHAAVSTEAVEADDIGGAVKQLAPQYAEQIDAASRAAVPLKAFLSKHSGERDKATFVELAAKLGKPVKGDELWVLAPAFLTTELREAFAIAVLIFLPFLAIDLIVGLGLAALGLQATSPQSVALPLKLLLFVAVDGWRLLVESLLKGYA
jgi:type III secretion protein R